MCLTDVQMLWFIVVLAIHPKKEFIAGEFLYQKQGIGVAGNEQRFVNTFFFLILLDNELVTTL